MKIESYYEVRVDGEKVAAFAPIRREASNQVFKLVESVKDDLYRGGDISVVAIYDNKETEVWNNLELAI